MTGLFIALMWALPGGCGDKDGEDTSTDGGGADGGATSDGGTTDGGTGDGGATGGDGGTTDGGTGDGGTGDGGTGDGGTTDGGTGDGGTGDGGTGDGGTGDGGTGDGGTGDGGADGGTGDGGAASCLEWTVHVVLDDGSICTTCPSGAGVSFLAQIENTCSTVMTVTTRSTCLVSGWSLTSGSTGEGWGEVCGDAITDWTIAGGSAISSTSTYGRIRDGRYEITASFDDMDRHSASQAFVVE